MIRTFIDTGSIRDIAKYANDPKVTGFTTNPSLILKAAPGPIDYYAFCRVAAATANGKCLSLPVVGDPDQWPEQVSWLNALGEHVYAKIPIIQSDGVLNDYYIDGALGSGARVNITALISSDHIGLADQMTRDCGERAILSLFMGRIQDLGGELEARSLADIPGTGAPILWGSTRSAADYYRADYRDFDIITMAPAIYERLVEYRAKTSGQCARETVAQFDADATAAYLTL